MAGTFDLLVEGSGPLVAVHIVLARHNTDEFGRILVTPACARCAEIERHIDDLVSELRQLKQAARQKFIEAGQPRTKKSKRRTR